MDTLKTAVVVILLLAVLYGVYTVLNKPVEPLPPGMGWDQQAGLEPLQVDIGPSFGASPEQGLTTGQPQPTSPLAGSSTMGTAPSATAPEPSALAAPPVSVPDLLSAKGQPQTSAEVAITGFPADQPQNGSATLSQPVSTPDAPNMSTAPLAGEQLTGQPAPPVTLDDAAATTAAPGRADGFGSFSLENAASPSTSSFNPFENAIRSAQKKVDSEEWYDALWTLSLFYDSPDLSNEQHEQLRDWLDPLAAKVIYSQEHLIEQAYQVQRGETLRQIAERHGVPWQLLANINGVENPDVLTPGTSIKVLRGPLRAEVNVTRNELTVFAGKLYAGRFPISIGADPTPRAGEFHVLDKQSGRTYYAGDGQTIAPGEATNPYGQVWIDLGSEVSIHGSPHAGPAMDGRGCISLSPRDANDVFGILSKGSTVSIR